MVKTFSSFSFGCRVNHAEREEIDRQMVKKGIKQTSINPDVFIINTCSVTHSAERSARQLIYQTKQKNPNTKIVVTGCSATYWLKNGLYKDIPADMFIDNTQKEFVVNMIIDKFNKTKSIHPTLNPKYIDPPKDKFIESGRLIIKIQDGCHRFCTFCIVPYLRGLPKSNSIYNIIKTIKSSKEELYEVILTAINTEAFGEETGENINDLIHAIIKKTSVPRISFGSIHPWSVTDEFINLYQDFKIRERLVHFFHIPLQSGSNKILSLMRRVHTREDMLERINKIAKINPFAFIATDVIVGFLDEDDDDFDDTYTFLKNSSISRFHVFRFSKRIQTGAYFMSKRIQEPSDNTKKERSSALRKLSDSKFDNFLNKLIGYKSKALILQKKFNRKTLAILDNQIEVAIINISKIQRGIVDVEVVDKKDNLILAKII